MEIEDLDTALKNEGIEVDDMRLVFGTYSDNSGKTSFNSGSILYSSIISPTFSIRSRHIPI